MARIFISHSGADNVKALALCDWLRAEGWGDAFLDLDPSRGISAGERWEQVLVNAVGRCEVALFLLSRDWLESEWCRRELVLADKLNKRLFGVLIENITIDELPPILTTWQVVTLATGRDPQTFTVKLAPAGECTNVAFSAEGLLRLKTGLRKAGLDPLFFEWPPKQDPDRAPYRGLAPFEAEDAGIFFGRDIATGTALDTIRGLRVDAVPRLLVILGASGAGKSSFLRAGLVPRLRRDDDNFVTLPVIRPDRAALFGDSGFARSLEQGAAAAGLDLSPSELEEMLAHDTAGVLKLLDKLAAKAAPPALPRDAPARPPAVIISIDQGEELFLVEGAAEAERFCELLTALLCAEAPAVIVVITVRTDRYEPLQAASGPAKPLSGLKQHAISLPPMSRGLYTAVIEGPAERLRDSNRPLKIEVGLKERLLEEVASGDDKDSLPLLAFTLERLYRVHGSGGVLTLSQYEQEGGVRGSIEAAVEDALAMAAGPAGPTQRSEIMALLRAGFIPWLAGIDLETHAPRRRVALMSEIPPQSRPLIRCLIEQRLLTTDVETGSQEMTVEPAHEALLRQWRALQSWLDEDRAALIALEWVKRAASDWSAHQATAAAASGAEDVWLIHRGLRLIEAEGLLARSDFASVAGSDALRYISACRAAENAAAEAEAVRLDKEKVQIARNRKLQRRGFVLLATILLAVIGGVAGVLAAIQGLNQRASNTLAALAHKAFSEGLYDRGARYALAGVIGRDDWLIGFDGSRAENELRLRRPDSGARGALVGHIWSVTGAVFLNGTRRVATASFDGNAYVWDTATGRILFALTDPNIPQGKIQDISVSPDESRIVTASFDGYARIWDARDGRLLHRLPHPVSPLSPGARMFQKYRTQVWAAKFSENGALVATGAEDGVIRLWNVRDGTVVPGLEDRHTNKVDTLVFSDDGTELLSTSDDGDVHLMDTRTGHMTPVVIPPPEGSKGVTHAALSPDGNWIAVGYSVGKVKIWSRLTGKAASFDGQHNDIINSVVFDRLSQRVLTASADKTAIIWDIRTLRIVRTITHTERLRVAVFTPDNKKIVTTTFDGTVHLWDAEKEMPAFDYKDHEDRVWSVAFDRGGRRFVTASYDGTARIWDMLRKSGTDTILKPGTQFIPLKGHADQVFAAAYSPSGKYVITGGYGAADQTARVWDARTGEQQAVIQVGDRIQAVAMSPDDHYVVTGSYKKFLVEFWDWKKCRTLGAGCASGIPLQLNNVVSQVSFSPDGKRLLTSSRDGYARVWDARTRTLIRAIKHRSGALTAAFSPDGRLVVSGSFDDAWLWDSFTGRPIYPYPLVENDAIRRAVFSRNGRWLAAVSERNKLRVWNIDRPKEPIVLDMDGDTMWDLSFSSDDTRLAVASQTYHSARIFDVLTAGGNVTGLRESDDLQGHGKEVDSAEFSPVDPARIATASFDNTARIWTLPGQRASSGDDLTAEVCRTRLPAGVSIFTPSEIKAAPVLDPELDKDPCHPYSGLRRLLAYLRRSAFGVL